jgi:hypothetical protein
MTLRSFVPFIVGMAASCGPQPGQAAPQECAPVTTELPAEASADGMAGEYQLRMFDKSGTTTVVSADGRLLLLSQDR